MELWMHGIRLARWLQVHRHPKFIVTIADLQPISPKNRLMKYADDTYLLIGSRNIQSLHDEHGNITAWADRKNLHLNPAKTREMVYERPGPPCRLHHRSQQEPAAAP